MTTSEDENSSQFETSLTATSSKWKQINRICKTCSKITVEPLLMVSLFTVVMYSSISQQYIYQQMAKKYGLANNSKSTACHSNQVSNDTKELQAKVSAETSAWVLYLNIAGKVNSLGDFCSFSEKMVNLMWHVCKVFERSNC